MTYISQFFDIVISLAIFQRLELLLGDLFILTLQLVSFSLTGTLHINLMLVNPIALRMVKTQ